MFTSSVTSTSRENELATQSVGVVFFLSFVSLCASVCVCVYECEQKRILGRIESASHYIYTFLICAG